MSTRYEYQLDEWEQLYRATLTPITVDFRALVNGAVKPERYTHLLHSYPAKLLPHIPYLFLRSSILAGISPKTIADPFCGSGTVLLESAICGHHAIGADSNPLARLISKVKTQLVSEKEILHGLRLVNKLLPTIRNAEPPPVVNINTWYREETALDLAKLRIAIKAISNRKVREFFQVCLSVCARKVSLADPRLSVPVKINILRKKKYGPHYRQLKAHLAQITEVSVVDRFNEIVTQNAVRMKSLRGIISKHAPVTILDDASTIDHALRHSSVDLIITSPPYAGAQKYIRACSLNLGWLDFAYEGELRQLERKTIGREHFPNAEIGSISKCGVSDADRLLDKIEKINPLRAHIAKSYLIEMDRALRAMRSILKTEGHLVLITGPNTICGFHFDTPSYIEQLAHQIGFETQFKLIDHIRSRGLMTKRNKTAGVISSESVLCMGKIR